jgi:hypothetical protein
MKYSFETLSELSDFLKANSDKKFKIKTKFMVHNGLVEEIIRYEITELTIKKIFKIRISDDIDRGIIKSVEETLEASYKANKIWWDIDMWSLEVVAIDKVNALAIAEPILSSFFAGSFSGRDFKRIFSVTISNSHKYEALEVLWQILTLNQVVQTYPGPGMEVKVSAYNEKEAILKSKPLFKKYQTSECFSLSDIEAQFQALKEKALKAPIGVGNSFWTRLFHGKDILALVRSFYQFNWGYKQKLESVKDLKNIKVSGMFLTDEWLTVTIRADIEK